MKRVLFRKILISYLIIAPILFVALELYLSNAIKSNYISKLRENLLIQSRLIAEQIPAVFTHNLDDFCKKYKEKTDARVTVIDTSGRVLGDSDELPEKMDNHADRPEIREASINNSGSSIRFSKTLHKDFFYLAASLGNQGFLRLAVPLHDLEAAISDMRMRIAIASFTALLIAILLGLIQTKSITKSIEEIAKFSREVKSGNFRTRLFLKEKGEIGELAKNINDMAQELKIRLEHSQKEQHKIEEILKNMSDGLMLTDIEGRIFLCNPAVKRFFGIESNVEGKTLMETLRNAEIMDVLNKTVKKGEEISSEIAITHPYPKELHLIVTAVPFRYPPESKTIFGVVLSLHDITQLKKLEDVRKDFIANVSHEIKTPITAIKGFAETLIEGAIDDRENAGRFLQTIKSHSERLNSLVEDLLMLSRIEQGDIKIEMTGVNLNDVTDTVFTTLKDKADAKGIQLKKDIPADFHEIKADRNRLTQILLNLVDNGIKFTEKGSVVVKVKSEKLNVESEALYLSLRSEAEAISKARPEQSERDEIPRGVYPERNDEILLPNIRHQNDTRRARNDDVGSNFIEISIEDTGIGIPKHNLSRLGERFYRVDTSRSRELGGTGLGLAIVKHLVKAHRWDMQIESIPGKGTKVKLICPAS